MRAPALAVIRQVRALLALGLLALTLAACAAQPPVAGAGVQGASPVTPVPTTGPARVALLAPFGGSESSMQAQARDLEAAARLALEALPPGTAELTAYDTAADPARAADAARRALAEGAVVLIGPFFAAEAQAVAPVAQAAGVQALAFTPFSGAAGPSTLVLGFAPENEVERVLGYAAQQGRRNVAVVYPQYQYGEIAMAAADAAAPRVGARIVARLPYPRSFQGVQTAIGDGAGGILASGADAVLIPEGREALDSVASFLAFHDVSPRQAQFLGLAQWGEGRPAGGSPLQGGWFAAPDPAAQAAFAERFRARTGRAPVGVAGLGYDAMVAVGALAQEGRAARDPQPFARQRFLEKASFPGASGPFRFGPDGVVRRALAVLEVTPDGFVTRDPAPAVLAPAS